MTRFDLKFINGHLFASIGDQEVVVDTGSQLSLSRDGRRLDVGHTIVETQPWGSICPEFEHILFNGLGRPVDALLGMDAMTDRDVGLHPAQGKLTLAQPGALKAPEVAFDLTPLRAQVDGIMHEVKVPVMKNVTVNGKVCDLLFDTAAQYGYLEYSLLAGSSESTAATDFAPLVCVESFDIDLYSVPVRIRDVEVSLRAASRRQLPEKMCKLLRKANCNILGSELLQHFAVTLSMTNKTITFRGLRTRMT